MAGKMKKTKRVAKASKRTVKGKTGVVGAFKLPINAALAKKLSAAAAADDGFKGNNPNRYAMTIIKNFVTQ